MYYNCNTMEQVQIRITKGLIQRMDSLVDAGLYSTRSDVVRDAVRRLVLDKIIGIIPDTGDSVKEVKAIRKKLSKDVKRKDLKKINTLID